MKPSIQDRQRLWDIVRFLRQDAHMAGLISDDEYVELARDHDAVARLETYDVELQKEKNSYRDR